MAANFTWSGRLYAGVQRLKPLSICRLLSCYRSFQVPSHGLVSRTASITQRRKYFPWPTVAVFTWNLIRELYRHNRRLKKYYRAVDADLPSSCQHTVLERTKVMSNINESIQTLTKERAAVKGSWPVLLFLCGLPGIGKTQIAIELAKMYQNSRSVRTIGWIDASDTVTTIRTLRTLGMKLNREALAKVEREHSCLENDSSRKYKLADLQEFIQEELRLRRDWLLIIDGVTSESPGQYLPLRGSKSSNWGSGLVVATTRKDEVPQNKSTGVFHDCKMSDEEAGELLQDLCGVPKSNIDGMDKVVKSLGGNSWCIASAGIYIKEARENNPQYGFHEYFDDYEKNSGYLSRATQPEMTHIDMRFQQYTNQPKVGQMYDQMFMLLACTKNWRDAVPLSVVSRVLGDHSRNLKAQYVLEHKMIKKCSLLQIQRDSDAQQKGLVESDVDGVETSVTFCNSLAHEAAQEHYGMTTSWPRDSQWSRTNEASSLPLDSDLQSILLTNTVRTIVALNEDYLDTFHMESSSALRKRRQLLPLTGTFLKKIADWQSEGSLNPLVKAGALACHGHAQAIFEQSQEGSNHPSSDDAHTILHRLYNQKDQQDSDNLTIVRLLTVVGSTYRQLGRAEDAVAELTKVLDMLNKLPSSCGDQILYGDANIALSVAYARLGKYRKAGDLFQKALETFQSLVTQNDEPQKATLSKIAYCQSGIGMTKLKCVTDDLGESHFDEALKIQERLNSRHRAYTLQNKATIYRKRGSPSDLEQSSEYLMKALALNEETYGNNHTSVATVMSQLSNIRRRQGKMEEALNLAKKAYEISSHVHFHMKAFDPSVAMCLSFVARTKRDLGQFKDAEDMFEESMKIYEHSYGPNHGKVIAQMVGLASVYRNLSKPKAAEQLLKRALQRCQYVQTNEEEARNHRILARVYEMLDLPDKAFQHWEDALKFYEEYENGLRGVTTTSQVAVCQAHMAYLKLDLNNPVKEERVLENLLEPYYAHTGDNPYSPEMTHIHYMVGKLKLHSQQYSEAIDIFGRVAGEQTKFLGHTHPRLAVTLAKKSVTILELYRKRNTVSLLDEVHTCLEEAQSVIDNHEYLRADHVLAAEVHSTRGFLLCERYELARNDNLAHKASWEFDKALRIWRTTLGKDNRKYAKCMAGRARAAYHLQDIVMAELYAREARECFETSRRRMLAVAIGTGQRRVYIDNELEILAKLESQISQALTEYADTFQDRHV